MDNYSTCHDAIEVAAGTGSRVTGSTERVFLLACARDALDEIVNKETAGAAGATERRITCSAISNKSGWQHI